MKRQFFRFVLTALISLPLVSAAQTSPSIPNNGINEMDRQVAIHIKVISVETPRNNKKIDWSAVVKSPFTDTTSNDFSGVAIVDEKTGTKGFINALSKQATVSVITQSTSLTTNQSVVPFQYLTESDRNKEGFNMTVLPLLTPSSLKMQLQLALSVYDTKIQTFSQYINIQSGQTLVLGGNQGERNKPSFLSHRLLWNKL